MPNEDGVVQQENGNFLNLQIFVWQLTRCMGWSVKMVSASLWLFNLCAHHATGD